MAHGTRRELIPSSIPALPARLCAMVRSARSSCGQQSCKPQALAHSSGTRFCGDGGAQLRLHAVQHAWPAALDVLLLKQRCETVPEGRQASGYPPTGATPRSGRSHRCCAHDAHGHRATPAAVHAGTAGRRHHCSSVSKPLGAAAIRITRG